MRWPRMSATATTWIATPRPMERHLLGSTLRRFAAHPLVRAAAPARDAQQRWRAAEEAACAEAAVAHVRRIAAQEPPAALARSVQLAVDEVQRAAARYPDAIVRDWAIAALRELGGLLFAHAIDAEVTI